MMVGAGATGSGNSMDMANMIKPALMKGNIKVVASTTWEEYRKFFEKDRDYIDIISIATITIVIITTTVIIVITVITFIPFLLKTFVIIFST